MVSVKLIVVILTFAFKPGCGLDLFSNYKLVMCLTYIQGILSELIADALKSQ